MAKRIFDLLLAVLGLCLLSPLLLLIAILIKRDSAGEIFFRQERVGLHGRIFRIHKFRTMTVNAQAQGGGLTVGQDRRITKIGGFLRQYKLDELPQLIDVLQGNMSLVGPRPELAEFMNLYPDEVRAKILSVKPGITDRASIEMVDENQILAQYEDPRQAYIDHIMPLKAQYYVAYAEHHHIWEDIQIIFQTIIKIVSR